MDAALILASSKNTGDCELFGWFGWMIQILLGLACLSVLIVKKYTDTQKRSWKVWFMDTSK
jgi:hypothetical protein